MTQILILGHCGIKLARRAKIILVASYVVICKTRCVVILKMTYKAYILTQNRKYPKSYQNSPKKDSHTDFMLSVCYDIILNTIEIFN